MNPIKAVEVGDLQWFKDQKVAGTLPDLTVVGSLVAQKQLQTIV